MMESAFEICVPDECIRLDQDEEWIELTTDRGQEKIRLHEYGRFYEIPGLYDHLYERLCCQSPAVVCGALKEEMQKSDEKPRSIRVLDFGAGNGQVGETLAREFGCGALVGIDILPQAKEAALRERPGVYDKYYVADLANLAERDRDALSRWRFNTLVTVAALGFGDIGAKAFFNAINLIEDGGWVAFNIKDRFLSENDDTGFHEALNFVMDDSLQFVHSRRYRHRYSLAGDSLYYYVIVCRKLNDIQMK
jgi:predicted TPR repeat methyltransferase